MSDTPPLIDIRPDHWIIVRDILLKHVPQYEVWAFGSRATWKAKEFSDLDLAIITDKPLSLDVSARLSDDFSESDLPWKVDVVDWANTNESFRKVIERHKVVVQKGKNSFSVANDWCTVSLGEIFKVKHGFAFKGEFFTDEPQNTVLVTPRNFAIGGGFQDGKRKYYGGPVPDEYVLKPGQVVVSMTDLSKESDTLGYTASIPNDSTVWLHNQRVGLLKFNSVMPTSPRFIQYLLRSHEYRSWVVGSATGTTVKHTSPGRIESFTARIPPINEQQAIAHILSTLDDKIELNRQMNKTLESIAQALFKSWFVDFDPVRAKMEGREPEGMDVETAALFPDDFEESELGLAPRGWRVVPVGDVVECVGGGTPDTKEPSYWDFGQYCWTTPKDLSGILAPVLLSTERKLTAEGLKKVSSGLLPQGTLIMSSRAPIGYLAIMQIPMAINQGYIGMLPNSKLPPLYMLFWCQQNMDIIKGRANGSTFMEISKKAFRPIPALVPSISVIEAYVGIIGTLFNRIVNNEKQAQTLATLRDSLLPHLISGQLRLPESEEISV